MPSGRTGAAPGSVVGAAAGREQDRCRLVLVALAYRPRRSRLRQVIGRGQCRMSGTFKTSGHRG
jgi:hypothetical protein